MKQKPKYILLIGGIVFILCVLVVILVPKMKKDNNKTGPANNYTIHYYSGYFVYDIEIKGENIYVQKSEDIQCIQAPCNPIKVGSFQVKYQNEYQILIENLFKAEDPKEITIQRSQLSEDEIKIISSIVKEELKDDDRITYNIINDSQDNNNYVKRGYYVKKLGDGKVRVTVAMGERSTGGYTISISKINIIDGGAQIYVEETSPAEGDIVTQAFTYPIAEVEFNRMPEYIMVESLNDFLEFDQVGNN